MVAEQVREQPAHIDFLNKVLDVWRTMDDWNDKGNHLKSKRFQCYLVDTWGFELYNETDHLKQNYPQWKIRIHDEKKYTLFLLRY